MSIFSIFVTLLLVAASVVNILEGEYESAMYLGLLAIMQFSVAYLIKELKAKDEQIRKLKEDS